MTQNINFEINEALCVTLCLTFFGKFVEDALEIYLMEIIHQRFA